MSRYSNEEASTECDAVESCCDEAAPAVNVKSNLQDEPKTKWAVGRSGTAFWASHDVVSAISPGLYRCGYDNSLGFLLQKMPVTTDDLIELPDENTWKIVNHIEQFWEMKDEFKAHGFLHKRGILMYGEPGSGKTSAIQIAIKRVVEMGGIALFPTDDPVIFSGCIDMIRNIEKTKPIVAVLEDFDTITQQEYNQNQWLAILDGEAQTDNIVFLATTNYIDKLDKRFIDRPSRFDIIQAVPMPSAMSRAIFLYHKEPSLSLHQIRKWVDATKGLSIAHLKEVIISVQCYKNSLDDTITRLKKMHNRDFKMEDVSDIQGFGFLKTETDETLNATMFAHYIKNNPRY